MGNIKHYRTGMLFLLLMALVILPNISHAVLGTPTLTPSTNTFIVGNTQTLTGTISGGTTPYTYNFIVSNSAGQQFNSLIVGNSFTQNMFAFTPLATGAYQANLVVTDSENTPVTHASANAVIIVTSCPAPASLTPNTVGYQCITEVNYQSSAVQAQTPLWFTLNALKTQQFETNTLNNSRFALSSNTVLNSIIEGNLLNLVGNANVLYLSNDVSAFIVAPSGFLPAFSYNNLYWEFVGNTITPANSLWNGTVGTTFQLANTIVGEGTSFAKEDDSGANVFTTYCNFGSVSGLPCGFSELAGATNVINTPTNILFAQSSTTSSTTNIIFLSTANALPNLYSFNTVGNSIDSLNNFNPKTVGTSGGEFVLSSTASIGAQNWYYGLSYMRGTSGMAFCTSVSPTCVITSISTSTSLAPRIWSIAIASVNNGVASSNYTNIGSLALTPQVNNGIFLEYISRNQSPMSIYSLDTRINPPNSIMPSTVFGQAQSNVIYNPPSTPTLTLLNPTTYPGQKDILYANTIGGVSPYTYNFIITSSTKTTVVFNSLYSGVAGKQNSSLFTAFSPGTYYANVILSDSAGNTVNSTYQQLIILTGSSSGNSAPIASPSLKLFLENHILFILIFSAAIIFIILFLLLLPTDLKKESLRPLFLMLFAIAFWVGTLVMLLSPENTISTLYPTYNVLSNSVIANTLIQYPSYTVNTISNLSVRAYNAYFYIWLGILFFLFFLLLFWFIMVLRQKTKRLLSDGSDAVEQFGKGNKKA